MKATTTSFQPGQSGNPNGRPKGVRNRATIALEAILAGDAEDITRKVVELAKEGDPQALRMCLDRLIPVRKDRPVLFDLPAIATTADLPKATNALLQAVASGELTPSEAADIGKSVDAHVRAIEATDLHERLSRLEAAAR
ncbi:DUF5681 domain-containing protein [Methylobacterium soli]|uniref:DUF5681 domain-containing protein n=1 Tax=Methylobacterium soli TaxID=553447 RepID=A0A6L3SWQ4_9HYPH|nr:DUF5681 domain-containing protein [Methylobacterium soli]KAB1078227.1 hypothetical protein F6X53_15860 [Methylobacterium soli]GJE45050.1 hypothetical protein AEGHOMDF_4244 [Methylobacterium soli]